MSYFASAAYAGLSIVRRLLTEPEPFQSSVTVHHLKEEFDGLAVAYGLTQAFFTLAPVFLIAHLLARDGAGMAEIGFDRSQPRRDIWRGALLTAAVLGGGGLLTWLGRVSDLPIRDVSIVTPDAHSGYIVLGVTAALTTAVAQEAVVNGYLVTRLGQIGWSPWRAILASAALRATYHVYQGEFVIVGHFVAGLVAAWLFSRWRRVVPMVLAHAANDMGLFAAAVFFGWRLTI